MLDQNNNLPPEYQGASRHASENLAANYLKQQGYEILTQNYTQRCGEIDVIAQKDEIVSFVEVKQRKNTDFGTPAQYVTTSKQRKIRETAQFYVQQNKLRCIMTFDVIEIYGPCQGATLPKIVHIQNAFY